MTRTPLVLLLGLLCATTGATAQQQAFRAATDAVQIDVEVKQNRRPVDGLRGQDFIVTDNGVRQTVTLLERNHFPLDVTLLCDVSSSVDDVALERLKAGVKQISDILTPADRFRTMFVSNELHEGFPFIAGGSSFTMAHVTSGGATSLLDALTAALMNPTTAGRRQLVVAFTDGEDTDSFMSVSTLNRVASLSDATLQLAFPSDASSDFIHPALRNLAELTGGDARTVDMSQPIARSFQRILDDYRLGYVLYYTRTGITRGGWHDVTVTVNEGRRYQINYRRGYQGASGPSH